MKVILVAQDKTPRALFMKAMLEESAAIDEAHICCSADQIVKAALNFNCNIILACTEDLSMVTLANKRLSDAKQRQLPFIATYVHTNAKTIHRAITEGSYELSHIDDNPHDLVKKMRSVLVDYDIKKLPLLASIRHLLPLGHPIQFLHDESDLEIIRMISEGKTNQQIADEMYFANQTVRNRVSRLLDITHVSNRGMLAAIYTS